MFIKKMRSKNYEYLQIIESYREGGKVKHRVIANLGRTDQLSKMPNWKEFSAGLERVLKGNVGIDPNSIREEGRYNWGAYCVYKKVWNWFRLDEIVDQAFADSRIRFDYKSALILEVISRLHNPCSKRKLFFSQRKLHGIDEISLQHLYRVLDHLADKKEEVEQALFKRNQQKFKIPVNVVLYDVTTLYFESVQRDDLRKHGFSKDHKVGEVQVVLALFTNEEGRPLGYHLYPGNTAETTTLIDALHKIKKKFKVQDVIVVADRGINSKNNLRTIKENGFDYVFSCRLKMMPKNIKEEATDVEKYIPLDQAGEIKYLTLEHINKTPNKESADLEEHIVCTWSKKRCDKDRKDRQRAVEKAMEDLTKSPQPLGRKKYIKALNKQEYKLDDEKIKEDEKWDGFYAIQTSKKGLSPEKVLHIYHSLWRIEESFRTLKHFIEIRPMFHWTEKRIQGHVMICFIAYLLEKTLELELVKQKADCSFEKIRDAINQMEFSRVSTDPEIEYYLVSKVTPLGSSILRRVGIKKPSNFTTPEAFKEKIGSL